MIVCETYLEPGLLALGPPVHTGVRHCVGVRLGGHEAGEAESELANVRAHLADCEDTGRAVTVRTLKHQASPHVSLTTIWCYFEVSVVDGG